MLKFHCNNTRRHPRTLAEAFPDERAYAIMAFPRPFFSRVMEALYWVLSVLGILSMFLLPDLWAQFVEVVQ